MLRGQKSPLSTKLRWYANVEWDIWKTVWNKTILLEAIIVSALCILFLMMKSHIGSEPRLDYLDTDWIDKSDFTILVAEIFNRRRYNIHNYSVILHRFTKRVRLFECVVGPTELLSVPDIMHKVKAGKTLALFHFGQKSKRLLSQNFRI